MKKFWSLMGWLPLALGACFGNTTEEQMQYADSSLFYFASNRMDPGNAGGDGDIFFTSFTAPPGQSIVNLTGGEDAVGDSDDHLCLLDFARGRAFFMSQRTDIGNATGDLDIFVVPIFGGVPVNLTDEEGVPGDDYCNDIHASTGDLIFTSNREDQGQSDFDIYRLALAVDDLGNLVAGEIQNLTNLPDDGSGVPENDLEGFEILVDDTLIFSSQRLAPDRDGVANCGGDLHLFALDLREAMPGFRNLSQSGSDNGCVSGTPIFTFDQLCGVVRDVDELGQPVVSRLVFTSDQNVGGNGGAQFSLDDDLFVVDPANPRVLYNLTDASVGDAHDICERLVEHSFADDRPIAENFVAVFSSNRQGVGDVDAHGVWSESVNSDSEGDLFMTDLSFGEVTNHLTILTDRVENTRNGNDKDDKFVGLCGTTLFFESDREDVEPNPGTDRDLYAVDLAGGVGGAILPISNNPDAATGRDQVDCLLGCDATLGSVYFVSLRDDQGSHGPVPDSDIFRVRFRDASFALKVGQNRVIENLTDAASGDDWDFADPNYFLSGFCGQGSLESDIDEFSSGNLLGPYLPALFQDDFGFGINAGNNLLFTSLRRDPLNHGDQDVDIFSLSLPFGLDQLIPSPIINRTDSDSSLSSDDAADGLEGFVLPTVGPLR